MIVLAVSVLILILGIVILVKGEVSLSKTRVVRGSKARIIGALFVASLPVTMAVFLGIVLAGIDLSKAGMIWTVVPVIPMLGLPATGIALGFVWAE